MLTFKGYCNYVFVILHFANVPRTLKQRRERRKERRKETKSKESCQGLSEPLNLPVPKEKFHMHEIQ